jgi:DNA-binding GntR family transcriptional regulator
MAQSATRAARIDRHEIEEAFIIRSALEMESAARAASHLREEDKERLEDSLRLHSRAIERKRYAEAIEQDDAFHRAIAEISGLKRLWRAIEISKGQLDRCRHMMLPRPGEGEATLAQHRAIIRALASRDPEKARAAMRDHLEAAYRNTVAVLDAGGLQ